MAALTRMRARSDDNSKKRGSAPVWRWIILLAAAVYFLLPLYAALKFTGISAFGSVISQGGFGSSLWLSVRLAIVTTVITLALMVPTTVYVHLRLPRLRRLLEGITILPIVIPPVVLIIGVLQVAPSSLKATPYLLALEYVVLSMPFAYRSIDAGLRALDLKPWRWCSASTPWPAWTCTRRSRCGSSCSTRPARRSRLPPRCSRCSSPGCSCC